jgi:F0F1-type ATP synthase assembly protein I
MSSDPQLRTISFDDQDAIRAAIRNHESFEVGECHDRMDDAVLFVERAIGGEGMTSRVFTKGRTVALAAGLVVPPAAAAMAVGLAAHNLATLNPDYEVMKRPLDKALRLTYVKDDPSLGERIKKAATTVGEGVSTATSKAASAASEVSGMAASAWDKHAPSKESVEAAAAKTVAAASDAVGDLAAKVRNTSPWALVGGTIAGVGAIVAAPVVGSAAMLNALTERAKANGFREGQELAAADVAAKLQVLQEHLVLASERYKDQSKANQFTICLIAVGAAMAACDGHIHEYEANHLSEFVLGASAQAVPPVIQEAIQRLMEQPPTFESAMQYVEMLDRGTWPVIDDILAIVSQADGSVSPAEQAFLDQWAEYKAARMQGETV